MPYRPLVSKIRVHNPNKTRASVANKNYVKYIATREGVALDDPENIDELLNMPGMEKISMNDMLIHEAADNDNYLKYIACRPRSHGLFGNIDTSNLNTVMKEVSEVSKQNRIVYRGVISLSERDAEELNFKSTAVWNQYLKKVMPELAKELGVSVTDHTWVAAFHAEKSHPHVHYELWDNKDKVKSPFIHTSTQKRCRELLSREMFDNEYENVIKQVYQEELKELKEIRNVERVSVLKKAGEIIEDSIYTPGVTYEILPERVSHEEANTVRYEINKLVEMMKAEEHGRIAYKLLPEEMKEQVDRITEILYKRPDVQCGLEKYINAVGKMQEYYGKTKTEKIASESLARKDMHYRICNKILKIVKANYEFGMKYFEKRCEDSAELEVKENDIKSFISSAEENNPDEQYKFGVSCLTGKGINKDKELGMKLLESSAEQGNQKACEILEDYKKVSMFDINISYTLLKAVLEDIEKQSRIQKIQSLQQSRNQSNDLKQNRIEEYKKNKDNGKEPE